MAGHCQVSTPCWPPLSGTQAARRQTKLRARPAKRLARASPGDQDHRRQDCDGRRQGRRRKPLATTSPRRLSTTAAAVTPDATLALPAPPQQSQPLRPKPSRPSRPPQLARSPARPLGWPSPPLLKLADWRGQGRRPSQPRPRTHRVSRRADRRLAADTVPPTNAIATATATAKADANLALSGPAHRRRSAATGAADPSDLGGPDCDLPASDACGPVADATQSRNRHPPRLSRPRRPRPRPPPPPPPGLPSRRRSSRRPPQAQGAEHQGGRAGRPSRSQGPGPGPKASSLRGHASQDRRHAQPGRRAQPPLPGRRPADRSPTPSPRRASPTRTRRRRSSTPRVTQATWRSPRAIPRPRRPRRPPP